MSEFCAENCFHEECRDRGLCAVTGAIIEQLPEKQQIGIARFKKKNLCQTNKIFCGNKEMCAALGYCMLDHPLIQKDKMALDNLRSPRDIKSVIKIFKRVITAQLASPYDAQIFVTMIKKKLGATDPEPKTKGNCKGNFRSTNCTNHKVCDILGQCMKEHPLIKNNEDIKGRLSGKFISTKECAKIFEETMPSLRRLNYRKNFKPDAEIAEEM